ncbi:MAG: hypothetical protein AAB432_00445 [Patescibacteria group bacterium]
MVKLNSNGQATLSFILLAGGIILEIAIAGSFITYFLSASGLSERLSARAYVAAEAGIRDAQIKITRNKDFSNNTTSTHTLSVSNDLATVQIFGDSTDPINYLYTITSIGFASTRERKLVSKLIVNKTNGLVQFQSLTEQTIQ